MYGAALPLLLGNICCDVVVFSCQELRRLADSGVVLDGSQQEALRRGLGDRVALIQVGSAADAGSA